MQIATLITTGQIVEIIVVKGGWTTIRANGVESKVRNGQLTDHGSSDDEFEAEPEQLDIEAVEEATPVVVAAAVESKPVNIDERKNGKIDSLYLNLYKRTKIVTNEGTKVAVDCGDKVAESLRGLPLAAVYIEVAYIIGVTTKELHAKYGHLNNGMQRMNLGNLARKVVRAKEKAKKAN